MAGNKNKDFDFLNFTNKLLAIVDGIVSKGKTGKVSESRVNAFYRGLGLPAVVRDEKKKNEPSATPGAETLPDKENIGSIVTELTYETYQDAFAARKEDLTKLVGPEEINNYLDENSAGPKGSIEEKGSTDARKRGAIFPMVVDGTVEIFPRDRRVAVAFSSDADLEKNKNLKLIRPLIETIILLKLKGQGASNSADDAQAASDLVNNTAFNELLEELTNAFESAKNNISDEVDKAVTDIGNARGQTGKNVEGQPNDIPQENKNVSNTDGKQGLIDKKLTAQKFRLSTKQALLAIFEFDDTSGTSNKRNIRESFMASEVMFDFLTQRSGALESNLKDSEMQEQEQLQKLKKAHQCVESVLGTFSGLSGTDMLAILVSMLKLPVETLIGLLNSDARENLKIFKNDKNILAGAETNVAAAVGKLEKEVEKLIVEIDGTLKGSRKHADKPSNKKLDKKKG